MTFQTHPFKYITYFTYNTFLFLTRSLELSNVNCDLLTGSCSSLGFRDAQQHTRFPPYLSAVQPTTSCKLGMPTQSKISITSGSLLQKGHGIYCVRLKSYLISTISDSKYCIGKLLKHKLHHLQSTQLYI